MNDELKVADQRGLDSRDIHLPIALGGMTISDFKQGAFHMHRDKKGRTCNQFLVVQVAGIDPWRSAVPTAHFLGRSHSCAAKKGMQGDVDPIGKVADHFFPVKRDDPNLPVKDLIEQESVLTNGIVSIRYSQLDGLKTHFQHVAGFRSFELNGPGRHMPARPTVLDRLY